MNNNSYRVAPSPWERAGGEVFFQPNSPLKTTHNYTFNTDSQQLARKYPASINEIPPGNG